MSQSPQKQTRRVTQGDANKFRFRAWASPGVPLNLSGAEIITRVPSSNEAGFVELDDEHVTLMDQTTGDDPDLTTEGVFEVEFESDESAEFKYTPPDAAPIEVLAKIIFDDKTVTGHAKASLYVDLDTPQG